MISLIIPTNKTNSEYTSYIVKNIREIYPDESQVEIVVSEDNTVTMGVNYNNAVARAKGEKIILLHNDMVIKPGFVEQMDKDIVKGRITAYTRIEPPTFPDEFPGKILSCPPPPECIINSLYVTSGSIVPYPLSPKLP